MLLALGFALLGCPPFLPLLLSSACSDSGISCYSGLLCLTLFCFVSFHILCSFSYFLWASTVSVHLCFNLLFHQWSSFGHSFVHSVNIHWSPAVVLGTLLGAGCWLEARIQP